MKQAKTIRQEKYAKNLEDLYTKFPQAKEVKERYKVMRIILQREWLSLGQLESHIIEEILKDAVHIDRRIRKMTEGVDQETKDVLEEKELEALGYGQTP